MKSFVLIGVILQLSWSNVKGFSNGVGAFSYSDSSGNRYGGTYGLKDGVVVDPKGTFPPDFTPPTDFVPPNFEDNFLGFFPEYFRNFENFLQHPGFHFRGPRIPPYIPQPHPFSGWPQFNIPDYGNFNNNHIPNYGNYNQFNRAFQSNLDSQTLALDAAHKAYDVTSNQAGLSQNLNPSRLSSFNDRNAGTNMPGQQFPTSYPFAEAFAGGSVGPGYSKQVAVINPSNPQSPNIFKSGPGLGSPGGFKSVSVSSSSSSSVVNGQKTSTQEAATTINDNGHISSFRVRSP